MPYAGETTRHRELHENALKAIHEVRRITGTYGDMGELLAQAASELADECEHDARTLENTGARSREIARAHKRAEAFDFAAAACLRASRTPNVD